MVTGPPSAAEVWAALDELPDPEIPVISLVELGVVRDVRVDGAQVIVTLTPTFLGCPALDAMRRALESKLAELGAEPVVEIDRGDSWTTDSITAAGRPGEAAGGGLRAARAGRGPGAAARPAPVEGVPLPVLRLGRDTPREPLRADAVPVDPLLRELPAAVRAVQDDLMMKSDGAGRAPARSPVSGCPRPGSSARPCGRRRSAPVPHLARRPCGSGGLPRSGPR